MWQSFKGKGPGKVGKSVHGEQICLVLSNWEEPCQNVTFSHALRAEEPDNSEKVQILRGVVSPGLELISIDWHMLSCVIVSTSSIGENLIYDFEQVTDAIQGGGFKIQEYVLYVYAYMYIRI